MDIPDRIIGDDVKLWRFRADVLRRFEPDALYLYRNPVPVVAGQQLVGFAAIGAEEHYSRNPPPHRIWADAAVEYELPERLDVETGRRLFLLPRVRISALADNPRTPDQQAFRGSQEAEIDRTFEIVALEIRDDCSDPLQSAINEVLF